MTPVTVVVRNLVGKQIQRKELRLSPETTASQLLEQLGIPGSVWVDGREINENEPVLPAVEASGRKEVEVRDP